MSDPVRIALVGATGLVGRSLTQLVTGRADVRLIGIARREIRLPKGVRMEMIVAEPANWGEMLQVVKPTVLVNALGTTWRKAGKNEAAFRAVDQDLVLKTAKAAHASGTSRMISISSVGADSHAKNFYLRVKGEVENDLMKIGFDRLDIIRPGLLRGRREGDNRIAESLGMAFAPIIDPMLFGKARRYRSITAETVAEAVLALALRKAAGRFKHENQAVHRAAQSLSRPGVN